MSSRKLASGFSPNYSLTVIFVMRQESGVILLLIDLRQIIDAEISTKGLLSVVCLHYAETVNEFSYKLLHGICRK